MTQAHSLSIKQTSKVAKTGIGFKNYNSNHSSLTVAERRQAVKALKSRAILHSSNHSNINEQMNIAETSQEELEL